MANFVERLSRQVVDNREELKKTLSDRAMPHEQSLQQLVKRHWHSLPDLPVNELRPAFAVDGSRAVRHLANGAYLFVAQALIVGERTGERIEETDVDVQILPGATDPSFIERFAGLMMHRLEVGLANRYSSQMPIGSVAFLDGALYGQLSSLYPLTEPAESLEIPNEILELPQTILECYSQLFNVCAQRQLMLISVAKTSHEVAHGEAWWRETIKDDSMPREISDSEMIYRWTDKRAGFSTPVLFGKRAFFRGSRRQLLDSMQDAPAIVSFFVRLDDFDDAMRIDVPAICLGRNEKIGQVEEEQLIDPAQIVPILKLLAADYGGLEVYNSLLYSVDREVRLRQDMMDDVYLSLIQDMLGNDIEIRLDRSERRFHSR